MMKMPLPIGTSLSHGVPSGPAPIDSTATPNPSRDREAAVAGVASIFEGRLCLAHLGEARTSRGDKFRVSNNRDSGQAPYLKTPANAAAPNVQIAHGRNTAVIAPPIDSCFPPAALSPMAISTSVHRRKRSSDVATE